MPVSFVKKVWKNRLDPSLISSDPRVAAAELNRFENAIDELVKAFLTSHSADGGLSAARIYNNAAQVVNAMNVDNTLVYNTVRYDTDDYWSGIHPTRLTAPKTGVYHIGANFVTDPPPGVNTRCYVKLYVNGTLNISQKAVAIPIGTDTVPHRPVGEITTDWLLNQGDYVEVIIAPDYGVASTNVTASPAQSAEFWMHYLGTAA